MSEHSNQEEQEKPKRVINAPHTKKYSYKENYDFIAKYWEIASTKYPEFQEYQADDLINFFTKFQQLPDHKTFFESNQQRKRFEEFKTTIFRKKYLAEANALKKKGTSKEEILSRIEKELDGILEKRQIDRLMKNIRDY